MAEKKKEISWEEIGQAIGKKIEEGKGKWPECRKPWIVKYKGYGGGGGRFIFAIGILLAMNYLGMLSNIPWWVLVIIVIGFTAMKL